MWPLLTNVGMMCSHDRADEEYFPFRVKETIDCLLCAVDMFSQGEESTSASQMRGLEFTEVN